MSVTLINQYYNNKTQSNDTCKSEASSDQVLTCDNKPQSPTQNLLKQPINQIGSCRSPAILRQLITKRKYFNIPAVKNSSKSSNLVDFPNYLSVKRLKISSANNSSGSSNSEGESEMDIKQLNTPKNSRKRTNPSSPTFSKSSSSNFNNKLYSNKMEFFSKGDYEHQNKRTIFPNDHTAITTMNPFEENLDENIGYNMIESTSNFNVENQTQKLKSEFESKFKYFKKLKQLPSQTNKNSTLTDEKPKKVYLDDAIKVLETILVDYKSQMDQEFSLQLNQRMSDQYETFRRYEEKYVKDHKKSDCSYLS